MADNRERKFVSAEDVELEIAIGDRRSAYDTMLHAASWLLGAVFALNGGAIVVLLSRDDLDLLQLEGPISFYFFGLMLSVFAGAHGGFVAMNIVERAEQKLDRHRESPVRRTERMGRVSRFLTPLLMIGGLLLFLFGTMETLETIRENQAPRVQRPKA